VVGDAEVLVPSQAAGLDHLLDGVAAVAGDGVQVQVASMPIATKASRVVESARGRGVVEFGARRAHGPESALLAARARIRMEEEGYEYTAVFSPGFC
jgi:nicotinic acid phosphoribosyltransferase